jgi:hypothetical protein
MAMKKFFFGMGSFSLRMAWRYGSRKINGLVMLLFGNSIRPYIALYVTKVILSPKLWKVLHHL